MPERMPALGGALLALAVLLAGASWLDIGSAGPLAWLAQVPAALGVASLRGSRPRPAAADAAPLALLWGAGFLSAGVLAAWPLSALLAAPSLGAALALSAMAGVLLAAVESVDAEEREAWRSRGAAFFQGRGRKAGRRARSDGEGAKQTGAGEAQV